MHLFRTILPRAKRNGSYVTSVTRMPGDSTTTDSTDMFGGDAVDDMFGSDAANKDADMLGSDSAENANVIEGAVDLQPSTSTLKQIHNVLVSPLKQLMSSIPMPMNADGISTRELRRSIFHATLF